MLLYLTKLTLILAVALTTYKLLLEDTMAHRFKRYYLLASLVLAIVFPVFTISTTVKINSINQTLVELSEVVINPHTELKSSSFDWSIVFIIIYSIGILIALIRLISEVYKIERLKSRGTVIEFEGMKVVLLAHLSNAFSFRQHIYLPITEELTLSNKILIHERTHVEQRHTLDILFIEILKVVFWFHPLFYYYKICIALNHEFLADSKSIASKEEANAYLELLLNQTYKQCELNITSSFNFNLTKKRFVMITKENKPVYNISAALLSSTLFVAIGVSTINTQAATPSVTTDKSEGYVATDVHARYEGGMSQFTQDFISRFELPKSAVLDNQSMVIVQFTVQTDGSLENIQVLRDPLEVGAQVISILETLPKWTPAKHNGEVAASTFTLPIKFKTANHDTP